MLYDLSSFSLNQSTDPPLEIDGWVWAGYASSWTACYAVSWEECIQGEAGLTSGSGMMEHSLAAMGTEQELVEGIALVRMCLKKTIQVDALPQHEHLVEEPAQQEC